MSKEQIIDRCLEIQEEYKSLGSIHLSSEDYEEISDLYQAKLELQWYKQDLQTELNSLNKMLDEEFNLSFQSAVEACFNGETIQSEHWMKASFVINDLDTLIFKNTNTDFSATFNVCKQEFLGKWRIVR